MAYFGDGQAIRGLIDLVRSPRIQRGLRDAPSMPGPFGGVASGLGKIINYGANPAPQKPTGLMKAGQGIGATIANLLGGGGQQTAPQDPMMALYQQLIGQLQGSADMPAAPDPQEIMRQVQAAINPIYDQRINQANQTTNRNKADATAMYGQLAKDYERLAPEQVAQAQESKAQIEDLYGQLRSNIQGDYSRVSSDQAKLFEQLGIEDALPDVLDDQDDAVNDALIAANENQSQQLQRAEDIGQMDATYYRSGAPASVARGNEIGTDLMFQLQQFVNQANAERGSAIQSSYMDQLGMAQNQYQNAQQMAMQENARRQEMLFNMLMSGASAKQQPMTADSFMAGLDPSQQARLGSAYTSLQRSPEMIYGKVEDPRNPVPGSFVETTPEWQMAQVDEMLKRGEIDPQTHQLMLMYIQLQNQSSR